MTAPAHPLPAPRRGRRLPIRAALVASVTALLLAAGAGVASAHVTVDPTTAAAGSYATLTFKVPTESAAARTVSVQVTLPSDHPLPSVSAQQVPGWTATLTKTPLNPPVTVGSFKLTEAVTAVTWSADAGAGIKPGQFALFALSVGPVPDVSALRFPAVQTYSDGSVVRWDQVAKGGDEPDHPAPTLTVVPAGGAPAAGPGGAYSSSAMVASPDTTARILGVIALVLAAAALLLAALGGRRRAGGRPRAASGPGGGAPSPSPAVQQPDPASGAKT